ncbi:hypothetical protein [Gimesia fumaroli]|uniref:hypothetical protein n=1 Tax=Gimesia fumaroli TaxID=2527976 RepID=UPI0011A3546D|nr:hypothetical protein [Gimesia fumaroli]
MSAANEIQDGIDDEITTAMKWVLAIASAGIGMILGAVVGFYGLYFLCPLMGGDFVQAGWGFLFFSVPAGVLAGGILGGSLPLLFHAKWK